MNTRVDYRENYVAFMAKSSETRSDMRDGSNLRLSGTVAYFAKE